MERLPHFAVDLSDIVQELAVTDEQMAEDYYRACAAEMMAKAQSAPSKAIRQAYLNLALNWAHQAAGPENAGTPTPTAGKKN